MSSFQEAVFQILSVVQEVVFHFAAGDFVVVLMIGAAIGGGCVLGVVRRSLSNVFVGALGGFSTVLILWGAAKVVMLAIGPS